MWPFKSRIHLTKRGRIILAVPFVLVASFFAIYSARDIDIEEVNTVAEAGADHIWFPAQAIFAATMTTSDGMTLVQRWNIKGRAIGTSSLGVPWGGIYAVSPDANVAAWMVRERLIRIVRLSSPNSTMDVDLSAGTFKCEGNCSASRLAFLDASTLAIILSDGRLKIWRAHNNRIINGGVNLEAVWEPQVFQGFLAAASYDTHDLGILQFDRVREKINFQALPNRLPPPGISIAMMSTDAVAVGTRDGRVVIVDLNAPGSYPVFHLGDEKSVVPAVGYYGDRYLFAAGDVGGIYSIRRKSAAVMKLPLDVRIEQLATTEGFLAFRTETAIELARLTTTLRWRQDTQTLISALSTVVGLILSVLPFIERLWRE
jgi:hypothetical protein